MFEEHNSQLYTDMNINHEFFGGLAAGMGAVSFIPYVIALFRKKNPIVPSKASWIIWAIMGLAILAGSKATGAKATIGLAVVYAVFPIIFLGLLFLKYPGKEKWNPAERIYFLIGLSLLVPWVAFKIVERFDLAPEWRWILPCITLCCSIAVDGCAAWPTVIKCWKNPASEDVCAWTIMAIGNDIYLLAVEDWSWSNWIKWIYPIYVTLPSGFIAPPLLIHAYKQWRHKRLNPAAGQ